MSSPRHGQRLRPARVNTTLPHIMPSDNDFASLMEGAGQARAIKRLRRGDRIEGTVIALGHDRVFLDVGTGADAWIDRGELVDESGQLRAQVADKVRAVVIDPDHAEGPRLAVTFGQASSSLDDLESAREAGLAVEGLVKAVNKGGLEVQIGSSRAFCPASQVELTRSEDLESYIGRTLRFKVTEIRSGSVVVSRRALLEEERRAEHNARLATLQVGAELSGTVTTVQRYGAFVDLGGVEGLIHVSELANRRVERVEDVVSPGDQVTVRVLAIEPTKDGTRVSLSMKALVAAEQRATTSRNQVLDATVRELLPNGVLVDTTKGSGMIRKRELDLAPGSDHRRAYPVGTVLRVVLESADERSGRLTFSMKRVAAAEERSNFAEYAHRSGAEESASMGTFGALFASKLGLKPPPTEAPKTRVDPKFTQPTVESATKPQQVAERRQDPEGVIRRKKH